MVKDLNFFCGTGFPTKKHEEPKKLNLFLGKETEGLSSSPTPYVPQILHCCRQFIEKKAAAEAAEAAAVSFGGKSGREGKLHSFF